VVKDGVDRALTAASAVAGLSLAAAFVAGMMSGPHRAAPEATTPDGASAVEAPAQVPDDEPAATAPDGEPAIETPAGDAGASDALGRRARGAAGAAPGLADPAAPFHGVAKVEVLNGAGTEGFARDATVRLRALGHDVVAYGNADRFDVARSVVYDRGDREGAARAVADALGISVVEARPDPDLALDATVILGVDWVLPPPPSEPEGRVRGFFRRLFGAGDGG